MWPLRVLACCAFACALWGVSFCSPAVARSPAPSDWPASPGLADQPDPYPFYPAAPPARAASLPPRASAFPGYQAEPYSWAAGTAPVSAQPVEGDVGIDPVNGATGAPGPDIDPGGSPLADEAILSGAMWQPPLGFAGQPVVLPEECWTWQLLPDGLMYKSYLAGLHEPRLSTRWIHDRDEGWLWDSNLGGRVGMIRYGTTDVAWPEGWQLDVEGAAFPRLDPEDERDLVSVDFRFGIPLTYRRGLWAWKFGYYHLSSHLGDEFLLKHHRGRINYVREALILGVAFRPHPDLRVYTEIDFGAYVDGGSQPWHYQFGAEYSPTLPSGIRGAPFLAVNGALRQENDYGGNVTVQAGWQWRGCSGDLMRFGVHYLNGLSNQYQFYDDFEEQIGIGIWYDY